MNRYRILVVEDDHAIRNGLTDALTVSGYDVLPVKDGYDALNVIHAEDYDLALLDVVLPGASGFDLLRLIRKTGRPFHSDADRQGGGSGQGARAEAGSGRLCGEAVQSAGSARPDRGGAETVPGKAPDAGQSGAAGGILGFSQPLPGAGRGADCADDQANFDLARHLAANAGRIITREEILTRVWKMDPRLVETRSIDTTIARLREKMGKRNAAVIRTLRGQGYVWEETA